MPELFDKHISKINKIIYSCTTVEHVESAKQVIKNFVDYWKTKVEQILVSPFNYNTWS
jgi:hypothetical protein